MKKSVADTMQQYLTTVRPMHLQHVEPTKYMADIIVPYGVNNVVLDLLLEKIKAHVTRGLW